MTYLTTQPTSGYAGPEFVVYYHDVSLTSQWINVSKATNNGYHALGGSMKALQHKQNVSFGFAKVFETPNYTATGENYRCVTLAPNKKILIEYQFIMSHMETTPALYIDWSFATSTTGSDSSYYRDKSDSSNGLVPVTVHYENFSRNGEDSSYRSSIGQKVISHSQSGTRNLCIHCESSSDYNNSALANYVGFNSAYSSSLGSWFKITELE